MLQQSYSISQQNIFTSRILFCHIIHIRIKTFFLWGLKYSLVPPGCLTNLKLIGPKQSTNFPPQSNVLSLSTFLSVWRKEVIGNLTSQIWATPFTAARGGGCLTGLTFPCGVSGTLSLLHFGCPSVLLSSCPPWWYWVSRSLLFFLSSPYTLLSFSFWPSCGILVPWPEIKLVSPAVEAQSLNYWTPRKSLHIPFLCDVSSDAQCLIYHLVCSVTSVMSDS